MNKTRKTVCLTAILLAAIFAALSMACKTESELTAAQLCERAQSLGSFPTLEKADDELLRDFYGINLEKIESCELLYSTERLLADEIAVFKLADESYKSELTALLNARLKRAASNARDYSPEQYEIILKSAVEAKGSFVFYVVNEQSESIVLELKKLIKG